MKDQRTKLVIFRAIADKAGGLLNPADVVDYARPLKSPLHGCFTWHDTEAADQYRLWQARQLIRVVVKMVQVDGDKKPVRVFVSLSSDRKDEGGYREITAVLQNPDWRSQMLADALADLEVFRQKYEMLTELAEVFEAAKKVKKRAA